MPRVNLRRLMPDGVRVLGDPERIAQILDNVLGNALKYSSAEAPIEVSLTVHDHEAQIRVADYGVGIPSDERDLLFRPSSGVRGLETYPAPDLVSTSVDGSPAVTVVDSGWNLVPVLAACSPSRFPS